MKNIDTGAIIIGVFAVILIILAYIGHINSKHMVHYEDLIKVNLMEKGYFDIEITKHINTGLIDDVPKGCVTVQYSAKSNIDRLNDFNTTSFAYSIHNNSQAKVASILACNSREF